MNRILVRIYPPYRNTPVDIPQDILWSAMSLAEWFVGFGIKTEIVQVTTEEKEEVICMPILMQK